MHVGGVAIYDPSTVVGLSAEKRTGSPKTKSKLEYADIVKFVSDRTHLAKPFKKKLNHVLLDLDYPYWVDDPDFDISNHMRHYSLPKPGTWQQLCALAEDIFAQPLDLSRPLWAFVYIDGIDAVEGVPKGSFAILSKAHHCAIDGASGVDIASATHTLEPKFDTASSALAQRPQSKPSLIEKVKGFQRRGMKNSARGYRVAKDLLPKLVKSAPSVLRSNNWRPSAFIPMTRFNRNISVERAFGGSSFSFEETKLIREVVGDVTLNDVVLAVVAGAMRAYLEPLGELPKKPLKAMAPMAVKSKNRDAKEAGNDVANMAVSLCTHIADPIERLREIHKSAASEKALMNTLGAHNIAEVNKLSPPILSSLSLRSYTRIGVNRFTRPNVNTMVTNVPGPRVPLYFSGAKLVKQVNMAPLHHGVGLVHTVFSYCGEMTIGFMACKKMMHDPEHYEQCLASSLESLKAAVQAS